MSELARWDHAKWLQTRLGEARELLAAAERENATLREALREVAHFGDRAAVQIALAALASLPEPDSEEGA